MRLLFNFCLFEGGNFTLFEVGDTRTSDFSWTEDTRTSDSNLIGDTRVNPETLGRQIGFSDTNSSTLSQV